MEFTESEPGTGTWAAANTSSGPEPCAECPGPFFPCGFMFEQPMILFEGAAAAGGVMRMASRSSFSNAAMLRRADSRANSILPLWA